MPEHNLSERLRKVLVELEQVLMELDADKNCDNKTC